MSITNGYCTLAALKARLDIDSSDTDDDDKLENIVEGVSRWIDRYCNREFYTTDETRYFTPKRNDRLYIDEVVSLDTVEVATSTARSYVEWAATDYDTEPLNAVPITALFVAPDSSKYFVPRLRKSAKITATWGYASATPEPVREACLLQAERLFKRKDAPFGIAGSPQLGEMRLLKEMDPDVAQLLARHRRVRL
jgi:hypothetical protein